MLYASVGLSEGGDSYAAGANACQDAFDRLPGGKPQALMVFSAAEYEHGKVLAGVRSVSESCVLAGCSTSGELTGEGPAQRRSVAVMALASDTLSFFTGVGEQIAQNAREAGRQMALSLQKQAAGGELDACMMFSDVLAGNGSEIGAGALGVLGDHFPLIGGTAGDDFKFKRTFQYANGSVYSGAVAGLGVSGGLVLGSGVRHGWLPIGTPKKVTRASGTTLYELDGKPAITLYEEYFGSKLNREPLAALAITYPIGRQIPESDEFLIRSPLRAEPDGSIVCTAEIPEGADIRFMIGSREEAIRSGRDAAREALAALGGRVPRAAIVFDSAARSKLLGEKSAAEIEAIREAVGRAVPLIGFYAYGVYAPFRMGEKGKRGMSAFHNAAVVISLLAE